MSAFSLFKPPNSVNTLKNILRHHYKQIISVPISGTQFMIIIV